MLRLSHELNHSIICSLKKKKRKENSLVQVIEGVGDANSHFHSSFRGQFLYSCVSLFPEGLGVVLIRQTSDLPFLDSGRTPQSNLNL